MTSGGTVQSSCLLLVILATFHQLVAPCSVNINTSFKDVPGIFEEYRTDHTTRIVNINISGIEWSDSSNETYEVFDPNWWSWATKDSETLAQLPIDFSILSYGFSRITIKNLSMHFDDVPSGCLRELAFEHQCKLVMQEIIRLTEKKEILPSKPHILTDIQQDEEDLFCHSVYSQQCLFSGRTIGVGKICCTKGEIRRGVRYAECGDKNTDKVHRDFDLKFAAISVIGFLLPFVIFLFAILWLQFNPMSWSSAFADYLLNKCEKLAYFTIDPMKQTCVALRQCNTQPVDGMKNKSDSHLDTLDGKTLMIALDELEPYEGAVSLLGLMGFKTQRVFVGKIKLTLLVLFQFIPMVSWLVYYRYKSETLLRLNTTEKILFNLRNNPYSWLWTDASLFPHTFACVLVFMNVSIIIPIIFWWLLELTSIRKVVFLRKRTRHGATITKLQCFKRKENVQKAFKTFFYALFICSYVSVYSLFNSIIYIIGGLIISIDIVAPWITGVIFIFYYAQRSYWELVDRYTKIKHLVFKYCGDNHAYQDNDTTEYAKCVDIRRSIVQTNIRDVPFSPIIGHVWFLRDTSGFHEKNKAGHGQGKDQPAGKILKVSISKAMLYRICKKIKKVKPAVIQAAVKFVFIFFFLALVVFIMTVFPPNETGVLITSIVTLLASMIPRLAEMLTTKSESRLDAAILKLNIKTLLSVDRPEFKAIDKKTPDVVDGDSEDGSNVIGTEFRGLPGEHRPSTISNWCHRIKCCCPPTKKDKKCPKSETDTEADLHQSNGNGNRMCEAQKMDPMVKGQYV